MPRKVAAAVGDGNLVGHDARRDAVTSVLTFTQGNAATTIEFDGPLNDPAPDEFVIDLGKKQDTAILDWQPPRACLPMIWGVGGDDRAYDSCGSDFG